MVLCKTARPVSLALAEKDFLVLGYRKEVLITISCFAKDLTSQCKVETHSMQYTKRRASTVCWSLLQTTTFHKKKQTWTLLNKIWTCWNYDFNFQLTLDKPRYVGSFINSSTKNCHSVLLQKLPEINILLLLKQIAGEECKDTRVKQNYRCKCSAKVRIE